MDTIGALLWGFMLETLLYGIYLILLGFTLRAHRRHIQKRSGTNSKGTGVVTLSLTLFIFALTTTHWFITFFRTYQVIVVKRLTPAEAGKFLFTWENAVWIAQVTVYGVQRRLMDTLLVYRLCYVWNWKRWTVAFFSITVACDILSAIMVFYSEATANYPMIDIWVTFSYSYSCFTNITATGLIVHRTVTQNRLLQEFNIRTSLAPVAMILVESAFTYTILNIVLFVVFRVVSLRNTLLIMMLLISPLMAIIHCLITCQIALGLTVRSGATASVSKPPLVRRSNVNAEEEDDDDESKPPSQRVVVSLRTLSSSTNLANGKGGPASSGRTVSTFTEELRFAKASDDYV